MNNDYSVLHDADILRKMSEQKEKLRNDFVDSCYNTFLYFGFLKDFLFSASRALEDPRSFNMSQQNFYRKVHEGEFLIVGRQDPY